MKNLLPILLSFLCFKQSFSQVSQISVFPSTSGNIITGLSNYSVTEAIYLGSEIGNSNYLTPATSIDRIGFSLSIVAPNTVFPGLNIYFKEVPTASTDLASGAYSTTGYTLVFSGTLTANQVGMIYLDLSTPFTRTDGANNLSVLIERTTPVSGAGIQWNASVGNANDASENTSHLTARRYSGTIAPVSGTTNLVATAFRPRLYLSHKIANDASIDRFNTMPTNSCHTAANQSLSFTLKNLGTANINAGDASATLTVSNANSGTYTASNSSSIAPGGVEIINFSGINVTNVGTNNYSVSVSLAGDLYSNDNTAVTVGNTLPVISSFPVLEDAEVAGFTSFKSFMTINNGTRQLWGLRSTPYTNTSQTQPLNAHGGSKFILYDAFLAPTSAGTSARYFSDCISLPTTACPTLSFWMSHDNTTARTAADSLYVSVSTDKGTTWVRQPILSIGAGLQRHDATLVANAAPVWRKNAVDLSAFAGQTIQVGFEGVSKFGNGFGLDDIELSTTTASTDVALQTNVATYPLSTGCTEAGYTYYKDAMGKNVLAVEWGSNTASKASANATLTLDASLFAATSGSGAQANGTFTMKRYWNIDVAGVQPSTPVKVRFFYDAAERNATDNAATSFASANPGSVVRQPNWFKTNSGAFVGDASHVQPAGVLNATTLIDENTDGLTINGVLYAQFSGLTSFSGGTYASGVNAGAVLPISVAFFRGRKSGSDNILDWKITCVGEPSVKIIVERSNDGRNFKLLDEQTATDVRCLQAFVYNDINPLTGKNYYRLKTISLDGKVLYSSIVVLLNKTSGFELVNVAPNPVNTIANINVSTARAGNFGLTISDITGKIILVKRLVLPEGNNFIKVDVAALGAGTYIVTLNNNIGDSRTTRMVKY